MCQPLIFRAICRLKPLAGKPCAHPEGARGWPEGRGGRFAADWRKQRWRRLFKRAPLDRMRERLRLLIRLLGPVLAGGRALLEALLVGRPLPAAALVRHCQRL